MDDFSSHLKLYRKAKERVMFSRKSNRRGANLEDLESLFFDLEFEMEKRYCRDLVSLSENYERGMYY